MQYRVTMQFIILTILSIGLIPTIHAEDWQQWRGPNLNGTTKATNLPSQWDEKKNVLWSYDMPGYSSASPVVSNGRIFVNSNDAEEKMLLGMCFDLKTGDLLWSKPLSKVNKSVQRNDLASSSPVADDTMVYFTFASGELIALDHDGNEQWRRDLEKDFGPISMQFGYTSTPLLFKGRLYLPILRAQWVPRSKLNESTDKHSHVVALDAKTGDTVFRVHRPSDAVAESYDSYNCAVPMKFKGKDIIVVQGGDYTTGHDINTGKEIWRFADNPEKQHHWRLIPTPVICDDVVFCGQPRGARAYGFRPDPDKKMDLTTADWIFDERTTDVTTSVYHNKRLYIVNGVKKTLTCINPANGKVVWQGDLDGSARFWSSPVVADNKLYCVNEDSETVVVDISDGFKLLGHNQVEVARNKASLAIADNKLILRSGKRLYCIGQ